MRTTQFNKIYQAGENLVLRAIVDRSLIGTGVGKTDSMYPAAVVMVIRICSITIVIKHAHLITKINKGDALKGQHNAMHEQDTLNSVVR